MLRFVVGPGGTIVPDISARLPGRGIWLSARRDVLEGAVKRGAFARAARSPVLLPPDLTGTVVAGLLRRVGDTIGLARRAGHAVAGFTKAREWVQAGRAGLVVQAKDGSPDERARLMSGSSVTAVQPLTATELAAVFGRDHVVHVAILAGRLADAIAIEAERLSGMIGGETGIGQTGS